MDSDDQKFHWDKGMEFVADGIKALFILNGGASVALLTFLGSKTEFSALLVFSLPLFALGALSACFCYVFAYLTQLQYGNGNFGSDNRWHLRTYWAVGASVFFFAIGMLVATLGFLGVC